jgi:L-Ala-D/L-Glu epimerase
MELKVDIEAWHYAKPFKISYHTFTERLLLVVEVQDGESIGRGEAGDHPQLQSLQDGRDSILAIADALKRGMTRTDLMETLPKGPARNAVDCALWDLECKKAGKRIWELADLPTPRALPTAYTIGIAPLEEMVDEAKRVADFRTLKLKMGRNIGIEYLEAIAAARPDAEYIIDANEGWELNEFEEFVAAAAAYPIRLVEQPLHKDHDEHLRGFRSPIPLAADESFHGVSDFERLVGLYQVVNIKLDKIGGLTEALIAARTALKHDMKVMIGCNGGTSLGIAPGWCVGLYSSYVDLDSPVLLARDREPRLSYAGGCVGIPPRELWG